jgi:class 3 adenylate cyclase
VTHVVRPLIASGMPAQQAFEMSSKFGEASMAIVDQTLLAVRFGSTVNVAARIAGYARAGFPP